MKPNSSELSSRQNLSFCASPFCRILLQSQLYNLKFKYSLFIYNLFLTPRSTKLGKVLKSEKSNVAIAIKKHLQKFSFVLFSRFLLVFFSFSFFFFCFRRLISKAIFGSRNNFFTIFFFKFLLNFLLCFSEGKFLGAGGIFFVCMRGRAL